MKFLFFLPLICSALVASQETDDATLAKIYRKTFYDFASLSSDQLDHVKNVLNHVNEELNKPVTLKLSNSPISNVVLSHKKAVEFLKHIGAMISKRREEIQHQEKNPELMIPEKNEGVDQEMTEEYPREFKRGGGRRGKGGFGKIFRKANRKHLKRIYKIMNGVFQPQDSDEYDQY
ncbi:hypothetical protein L596_029485 [Steinernema carpocapsae]|uniref:SXP/RAL-2 family protein Ani s 5-like cation-binding domain-containing protein n=1 Tax=Steinernema carpocapsae TaxID=34508 RepID=A0A4V5ZXH6_STECR|nr:hypothetical protein L596_029485 [Steinernema carpocapsae]